MSSPVTQYRTCRHVLAKGRICGAAALKDHIFCHHHQRDRQRRANLRAGLAAKFRAGEEDFNAEIVASLDLPAPDDPEAALVCLSNTFLALAAGAIPEKRAALMIYNLQTINSTFYNLLKHREQMAAQEKENGVVAERAVTDPEPIASFLMSNRQADFEFSEQRYARKLETEQQSQTQRREDAENYEIEKQNALRRHGDTESFDSLGCHPERSEGPLSTPRTAAETSVEEAAFNADAARMQAMEHGDLTPPPEAPHTSAKVTEAVAAMSADDWEKYVQRLWLNGFIDDAQRDKLHAKIFHPSKSVREGARFLALKYAPDKVREVLERSSQSSVASSQKGRDEPRIA
jgi:hypothetical protein